MKPKVDVPDGTNDLGVVLAVIRGLRKAKISKKNMEKFLNEVAIAGTGEPLLEVLQRWVTLGIIEENEHG
jgi:hypothetical protein